MVIMGGVGMGLVWGWLLILVWPVVPGKRPFRNIAAIFLATTLVGFQHLLFTDWRQALVFLGTAVIGFSAHLAWRHRLQNEANRS